MTTLEEYWEVELEAAGIAFTHVRGGTLVEDWVEAIVYSANHINYENCDAGDALCSLESVLEPIVWILIYFKEQPQLHTSISNCYRLAGIEGVISYFNSIS